MTDQPADPRPPSRSGMMPLDGAPWPPRPTVSAPAAASDPSLWGTVERRPEGSEVDDWRTMPLEGAPDGYQGSATAPPAPAPRWDPWSIAGLVAGAVALAVAAFTIIPVFVALAMVALALGFSLAGRRATSVNPSMRGGALAALGAVAGAVAAVLIGARVNGWWG